MFTLKELNSGTLKAKLVNNTFSFSNLGLVAGPLDHGPQLLGFRPLNIIWMCRGYMGLGLLMVVILWAIWMDSDPLHSFIATFDSNKGTSGILVKKRRDKGKGGVTILFYLIGSG